MEEEALAERIARRIREAFPELNGRAFAVSEVGAFKDKSDVPTLPVAIVGLTNGTGVQAENSAGRLRITDNFVIEMIFASERHKGERKVLPFYKFYNYEAVRDRLLSALNGWTTPDNIAANYRSISVEADQFAVYITIGVSMSFDWCDPHEAEPMGVIGQNFHIVRS